MSSKTLLSTSLILLFSFMPLTSMAKDGATQADTSNKQSQAKPALFVPPINTALDKMHLNNANAYALDMLRSFDQATKTNNLVFSPTSLQFMLGMLGSAADNQETLKELNYAWHEPANTPIDVINEQLGLRLKYLVHPNNTTPTTSYLTIANGLFISHKYQLNPTYQQTIAAYNAQVTAMDFTKWYAVRDINRWVRKHTHGQIPSIIENLQDPANTALVLTNAIAFEGQWPHGYFQVKNTHPLPFTGIKGKKAVFTMKQEKLKHYYEDDNLQAIYLPYEGFKYALFIILPKNTDKDALDNLLNKLDIDYFNNITNGFFHPPVNVNYSGTLYLPRFKITYDNQQLLAQSKDLLGVDLNYDAAQHKGATFNKALANNPAQDLIISKIAHKAVIEVNEKGTKAAAVTHAELTTRSAKPLPIKTTPFTMHVNHPFIYGIMDNQQQLLFLGTVKTLP